MTRENDEFDDEKMSKFLNEYARQYFAVLKIFLKDPYYTNICWKHWWACWSMSWIEFHQYF